MDRELCEVSGRVVAAARALLEVHRQHLGDRSPGPAALGERASAAQHQQSASALTDEVRKHPQLVRRERGGLDTSEDDGAVGEEFFAGLRKAAHDFIRAANVKSQVLVLCRALEDRDGEVRIIGHRAPHELRLGPGFTLHVEDTLASVGHLDHRIPRIVLGDLLAWLRLDPEAEEPRAGFVCRERHPDRRGLAIRWQRHVFRADEVSAILDLEGHRRAGIPGLGNYDINRE